MSITFKTRYMRRIVLSLMLAVLSTVAIAQSTTAQASEEKMMYHLLQGFFLAARQHYAEAAPYLKDVGEQRQDPTVMRLAVRTAIQAQNVGLAQQYAALWLLYGGGVEARRVIAELFIASNQLAEAESALAALMNENLQAPADLYRQLLAIQKRENAVSIAQRLFPKTAEGQFYLAQFALGGGNLASAQTAIDSALQHDQGRADFHFLRALITQRETGEEASALPILQRYVDNRCYEVVKHCQRPAIMWAFSAYLKQRPDWLAGLNAEAAMTDDWVLAAGQLFERWEMSADAIAQYEKIPEHFEARLGLARIAEAKDDFQVALGFLQDAQVKDEQQFLVRERSVAHLFQQLGDIKSALQRIEQARQTVPSNFSLMYYHSLLLEQSSDISAALAILRKLTQLFPGNADGWNALGYLMVDKNIDLPQAQIYINQALSLRPNDPNIIDSLGWFYYRSGNLNQARFHLEKALSLSQSAEIAAHLGEVLWELGDTGAAKRFWQESLVRHPDNDLLKETVERYQPF